ncbi:TrmB family transcriptional regulator [Paenibacillus sp. NFR01]|uniref:TrmB family transcriptional regulator n=1 Tax=Paenibacillus sp. NFR01 TaxID=1566279 RepID=UPI0008AB667B|nr:helix-turn-helix domain-containing protein [Paenibacillus sp. NFR01]SET96272.1 Sugar-specific transcriptional regulator TrmB [Paenibacillus sp. NFR01]
MIESLRRLGLSDLEARCYLTLHGQPASSGYEVAKQVSVSRSNVYAALRGLAEKGICRTLEGDPVLYAAVPIGEVIKLLQYDFEHTARVLKGELTAPAETPAFFSNWKGDKQVDLAIRRLAANAAHDILVDLWSEDLHRLEEPLLAAEARGVEVHLMVIGEVPTKLKHVMVHSRGEGAPPKLRNFSLLLDQKVALLGNFGSQTPALALESNHFSLLDVLDSAYFHDVVMQRIERDFAPELLDRYGPDYARIRQEHPEMDRKKG